MQQLLSDRIGKIQESGIRKVFELATKNKGEYVNLSIGQPHFPTPDVLKKAVQRAIEENNNAYFPTMGSPDLREKILHKLQKENNIGTPMSTTIDTTMVTSGVAGGIFLALSTTINPGDEVILPDPYFVLYEQVLNYLGAKIVHLDTYPDFDLDVSKLEGLVSSKTKMIIINSPCNPTGKVYSEETLREVTSFSKKHDLLVLSDEIYEKFDFDNRFFSIGSVYDKTITLNGFSKSHSITGWRVGYLHAPKEIIEAMNKLQQYTFVCAPSFAQKALSEEFNVDISEHVEYYKKNRDFICDSLKDIYEFEVPEGAFYAFLKIPVGRENFIEEILENKLLIVPSEVFSQKKGYFRISFAVPFEELEKGVGILKRIA